jgi:hypothetical protein
VPAVGVSTGEIHTIPRLRSGGDGLPSIVPGTICSGLAVLLSEGALYMERSSSPASSKST